jgi:hypothetical protein
MPSIEFSYGCNTFKSIVAISEEFLCFKLFESCQTHEDWNSKERKERSVFIEGINTAEMMEL